jgi:hypothetical protein
MCRFHGLNRKAPAMRPQTMPLDRVKTRFERFAGMVEASALGHAKKPAKIDSSAMP